MDVERLSDLGNDEQEVGMTVQVLRFSASVAERIGQRPYEVNFASSIELARGEGDAHAYVIYLRRGARLWS
jgi:propanediol dehydratase small subunit